MAQIKFPMPEGFTLPEGGDKGSFEALATLEVDGEMLVLTAIDGMPVGGEGDESKETSEEDESYSEATNPDTGDFQKAVAMGMAR
jgi:hypothetical protein